ncbi:hypothetical protein SDC9_121359 [bioreactor metagenome]|uniref:Uncharacterized protein n=1 Tax=bioreactor metagenome TaxID=1076179 RepID=A0A645CBR6_9ZZZZ
MGLVRQLLQVHILREGHPLGMDLQYLQAPVPVRDLYLYLAVESSGPAQRLVDGVGSVGGTYDHHLAPGLQSVHQGEQLSHYAPLRLAGDLVALGRYAVYLVDEYDARRILLGLLEDLPELALGLSVELAHDLRPAYGDEVAAGLPGNGLRQHRLPGARRPVEQHPLGRLDPEPLEKLGVLERQLHHLPQLVDLVPQSSYVVIGHLRHIRRLVHGLIGDLHLRICHHHGGVARGGEGCDHEVYLVPHHIQSDGVALREYATLHVLTQELLPAL